VSASVKNNNQSSKDQDKGQKEGTASEQQIKDAITKANNKLKGHRTRCEFSYHEETKRVSIKVLDKDTQEVIREIPPEETLEMIERMWELAGLLIDEKR
jgi:flagellar protein FlaG